MYNEVKLESIKQALSVARQRQKLDPADTMQTIIYIAHVEHLLIELESVSMMNDLQARNIREYLRQLEIRGPATAVEHIGQ